MQPLDNTCTLGEYLGFWLAHSKGRVRQVTWDGYESLIRMNVKPVLADVPLREVTPLTLQDLYSQLLSRDKPLSGGSVLNLHLVLTHALGQAVRWGYLVTNPAQGAQPPRPKRAELALIDTGGIERLLLAVAGTKIECAAAIAIATGMRRGEVVALRWQDISGDYSIAHVRRTCQPTTAGLVFEKPKTPRSKRAVVLPEFIVPYLERQKTDQQERRQALGKKWQDLDLVIDHGDGRPYHPASLSSYWRSTLKRAGVAHVRFHDLRHAHATLMLSKGVHPKIVSERLGHASIGITLDTYSHVLPSMQQEAADAFDSIFDSAPSAEETEGE